MSTDYTRVFQDTAAVQRYETVGYAPDSYASAINHRQQRYLRALVGRSFAPRRPVLHDFACGTGRVIRGLHGVVRAAHGYDTSTQMLAKAAELAPSASLHPVPATGPVPRPVPTDTPVLVTVFRLLLNVDDAVRDRALAFAALALPDADAGLLVVENHGNRRSLRHLGARRHAGERWFAELSDGAVLDLLRRHGFELVERRGFSMLTRSWYARRWLRPLAGLLDAAAIRLPGAARFAVDVLYVARRTGSGRP